GAFDGAGSVGSTCSSPITNLRNLPVASPLKVTGAASTNTFVTSVTAGLNSSSLSEKVSIPSVSEYRFWASSAFCVCVADAGAGAFTGGPGGGATNEIACVRVSAVGAGVGGGVRAGERVGGVGSANTSWNFTSF